VIALTTVPCESTPGGCADNLDSPFGVRTYCTKARHPNAVELPNTVQIQRWHPTYDRSFRPRLGSWHRTPRGTSGSGLAMTERMARYGSPPLAVGISAWIWLSEALPARRGAGVERPDSSYVL
jgi:hypothetical protein